MLNLIALFAICCVVSGTHFRGAIIMWEPDSDSILIHFRISWRRSGGHSCDDNTISSGSLIGSGTMSCLSGCTGDVGSLLYQCTDYDATEDWTTGRYTVRYTPIGDVDGDITEKFNDYFTDRNGALECGTYF
ncbi:hypothetical protein MAR_022268 [Mya arenaria]|uniref:Uncharacterized protein n=1 Tax=Mya arenaria TaxID=6604 RepID=A0ABY7DSG4_MYAAR|nr:hypothetical protein MAR_022268 [Mya arenaria]